MDAFMVGYDLNSPGQNSDKLIDALKGYAKWWHYLDSTWLVKSSNTAVAIRDSHKQHIDSGDELLVIRMTGATCAWWGFSDQASQWILENL